MRRRTRLAALLVCTLLSGCAILSLLALPFKLLFKVVESVGNGLGALTGSSSFLDVHEGPSPRLVQLGDGRFTVEGLHSDSRFDVVVTAPGHETRRYRWPEDLAGLAPPDGGDVEVTCVLRRAAETE